MQQTRLQEEAWPQTAGQHRDWWLQAGRQEAVELHTGQHNRAMQGAWHKLPQPKGGQQVWHSPWDR